MTLRMFDALHYHYRRQVARYIWAGASPQQRQARLRSTRATLPAVFERGIIRRTQGVKA